MKSTNDRNQGEAIDNDHQKTVSGKNQHGPAEKVGKDAGGNEGSKGQNRRAGGSGSAGENGPSVGSHKPGGDGPGTKKFKHDTTMTSVVTSEFDCRMLVSVHRDQQPVVNNSTVRFRMLY